MDPKSELAALQAKNTAILANVKAGRSLTDAEAEQMHADAERIILLKSVIATGEKNAAALAPFETVTEDGLSPAEPGRHGSPRSASKSRVDFTSAGAKAVASRLAAHSIKGIIAAGSSGVGAQFDKRIVPLAARTGGAGGALSLFEVVERTSPAYEYLRQKTRTDAAATVAVGAEKPVSAYEWEKVSNSLAVWAHLSAPVDKYLMEDNAELEAYLEAEMRDGLFRKIEANVISSIAGTSGISTAATTAGFTPAKGFDAVYDAMTKLSVLGHTADLVVLHVDDYQSLRLAKDGDQRYYGEGPFTGGNPGLWGVNTFIVNAGIAKGTVLVLDSGAVAISTDTQGVKLDVNPYTGFSRNELTFRSEGRFATDVKQPKGVLKLTLTA